MKQQHKFSLGYNLFVFLTISLLELMFFAGPTSKDSPAFQPQRKQTPWYLNFGLSKDQQKQPAVRQFVVTRLQDPQLIADLLTHGVDYSGRIEPEVIDPALLRPGRFDSPMMDMYPSRLFP